MLTVTDKAAAALLESLDASKQEETQVLRLTRMAEGLGLSLDQEHEGDQVIEHAERKVLLIEQDISQALDGATLDAVETAEGTKLVLQSP